MRVLPLVLCLAGCAVDAAPMSADAVTTEAHEAPLEGFGSSPAPVVLPPPPPALPPVPRGFSRAAELYPDEIDAALAEWGADAADCDRSRVASIIADVPADYCGRPVAGCYLQSGEWHWIVIARAVISAERNAVTHELMHWLGQCDRGDPQGAHGDPAVWGPGGVLERVNGRLGLPHD